MKEAFFGEAACPTTPLIDGLYPNYHTNANGYDVSFDLAENELKSAFFGGQDVWNSGFSMTICYTLGAGPGRIISEMIRDFFATLSTYDHRVGPPFTINLMEIDWSTYLDQFENFKLPMWSIGWLPDFADADNWVRPYMHGYGDFSYFQNYTIDNGWGGTRGTNYPEMNKDQLIEAGLRTPDGSQRAGIYADLDTIYVSDCPSFPTDQPFGRRWWKYWVKGWYCNAMYPSDYYYHLYKEQTCWADVTGIDVGVPDGVENMRDIGYVVGHFGAGAPDTSTSPPYDARWAPGTYGYGGCDVYGDRKVDMRDIGFAAAHFGHTTQP